MKNKTIEVRKYKNIPVDLETYHKVELICRAYQTSERARGALIRKLVNAEFIKLMRKNSFQVDFTSYGQGER